VTSGIPWSGSATGAGYRGTGRAWQRDKPIHPSKATDVDRTCPQYFARSPMFLCLLNELADFRVGRMGNVRRDITALHHTLLSVLESEVNLWESYWLTEGNA